VNYRRAEGFGVETSIIFSPSIPFLGGTVGPAVGGTINTVGATNHAYRCSMAIRDGERHILWARCRWGYPQWATAVRGPEPQGAWLARVLFHIPIEIGYRFDAHNSLSAYFEHTSNAFIVEPNEGLDRLGVRYGYRF
jgi:lipid A 3-O-deacylase